MSKDYNGRDRCAAYRWCTVVWADSSLSINQHSRLVMHSNLFGDGYILGPKSQTDVHWHMDKRGRPYENEIKDIARQRKRRAFYIKNTGN